MRRFCSRGIVVVCHWRGWTTEGAVELALAHAEARSRAPEVRDALEPVRRALRHLAAVADDLRAAALPAGSAASARVDVPRLPLRVVVEDLVFASRDLAEEEGVELQVDGELPAVEVDAARLELILVNLMSNAIHHADGGKPERWVRLAASAAGDGEEVLQISVRDNGVGTPAELRAGLFEDPPGAPDGTPPRNGMGLVIVRQAVERSGGRLWFETHEGVGTAVHFTLPLPGRRRPASPARLAAPPSAKPATNEAPPQTDEAS